MTVPWRMIRTEQNRPLLAKGSGNSTLHGEWTTHRGAPHEGYGEVQQLGTPR